MDKESTSIWDAAEHLETDEDMAAYLEAAALCQNSCHLHLIELEVTDAALQRPVSKHGSEEALAA